LTRHDNSESVLTELVEVPVVRTRRLRRAQPERDRCRDFLNLFGFSV
jgi:hypothetical protein